MREWMFALLALVAGLGIGVFYFGGLWLTVRRLSRARRPALLMLGSFVGRTTVGTLAVYLVMGGQLPRLLACVAGVIIARSLVVRRLSPGMPS